ncbi:hypothetical protein HI914_06006 [Erysiphe necator]|nr:hypothetical protein HI914_06004 [Erysiphe necator]KAI6245667.1 hypothetical protein HI914_06006 [Erysiphe necator]
MDTLTDIKSNLRDFLRNKGVYVKKIRLFPVSTALFEAVQEELSWPQNDPDNPNQQKNCSTKTKDLSSPQNLLKVPESHLKNHEPKLQFSQSTSQTKFDHPTLCVVDDNPQIMPSTQQMTANFQLDGKQEFSRELTTLARLYTNDSQKYDGTLTDNITYKYSIFLNNCKNAGITFEMLPSAFPTMLHGRALEYYYMNCQNRNLSVENLITCFKEYFEGAQHRRHRLFEWNNISLRNILHQNPDHDKGKLFIEMVENLRKLQQGLDQEHRTDGAMYNRIVSACRTTPQCSFAIL